LKCLFFLTKIKRKESKMRSIRHRIFLFLVVFFFLISLPLANIQARGEDKSTVPGIERIEKSIGVIKEIVDIPEQGLPSALLKKSSGIAVIPGVIKAAYGFGGQYGRGIIMVRNERGDWSNPVFISLIGGSIGWQIGVQKADIILVFKSRKSIENIASGKVTLGADVSVSAGPVGRSAEASTDLEMKAEIYSYSKSRGLFAGVSIKGASIQIDRDANIAFYGRGDINANEIFDNEGLKVPDVVGELKKTLAKYTSLSI
jgi:lipid-binding SYLF domain-containing protein